MILHLFSLTETRTTGKGDVAIQDVIFLTERVEAFCMGKVALRDGYEGFGGQTGAIRIALLRKPNGCNSAEGALAGQFLAFSAHVSRALQTKVRHCANGKCTLLYRGIQ